MLTLTRLLPNIVFYSAAMRPRETGEMRNNVDADKTASRVY